MLALFQVAPGTSKTTIVTSGFENSYSTKLIPETPCSIMAAINGLLSLIGGASGLATLFDFMIPDPAAAAERGNCMVTVQVGLDGTTCSDCPESPLEGAGGQYPLVVLFNNNLEQIGETAGADMILTEIGSGAFKTLEIGTGSGYVHMMSFNLNDLG
jgi:hypothetical protein